MSATICLWAFRALLKGAVVISTRIPSCSGGTWTLLSAADAVSYLQVCCHGSLCNFTFGSFLPGPSDESEHFGLYLGPKSSCWWSVSAQKLVLYITHNWVCSEMRAFQVSISATTNTARIVLLFIAANTSTLLFLWQSNFVTFIDLEGIFILGFFLHFFAVKGQNCQERFIFGEKEPLFKSQSTTTFLE